MRTMKPTWSTDGLVTMLARSMVTRLARIEGEAEDDIMEYVSAGSSRCYSYSVKPGAKVRNLR